MQLLISDTNVLLDLLVVDEIDNMFKLPYSFCVPDVLFHQELKEQHSNLIDLGLELKKSPFEVVKDVIDLTDKYTKPGTMDIYALALAKYEGCPLLTGDKDLRDAAHLEAVPLYGTIWIVEQLVRHNLITFDRAKEMFDEMKQKKRRLPWAIIDVNLKELEKEINN